MADAVYNNGNILFINDPNSININPEITNAIAQYQDMNISAELTAVRKGRSVITVGRGIATDGKLDVNFIGLNDNDKKDNPNYQNFTTNYYDGSTHNNDIQFESFGMSSIKVVINSSYVPQVNIQFVDLRGLSFFNQDNSPYRILFDFPPPIFNLRIKGYYGRTLEYDLHLVKYTSEFKSENGNFVIDAQFVGMTFAPLSDVLFRYVTNMPLINATLASMNGKAGEPPKNTYDFILKLQNLYTETNDKVKTSPESKSYDNTTNEYTKNQEAISQISNFDASLKDKATPVAVTNDVSNTFIPLISAYPVGENADGNESWGTYTSSDPIFVQLNVLSDYNNVVKTLPENSDPTSTTNRLYIGYVLDTERVTILTEALNKYRKDLLEGPSKGIGGIVASDIGVAAKITGMTQSYVSATEKVVSSYIAIDVTSYYIKLYRAQTEILKRRKELSKKLNELINNSIEGILGMRPTIYNIFKLILDDVDSFFEILRKTSNDAENHHNKYINVIANSVKGDYGENNSTTNLYSFPLIIKTDGNNCNRTEVRISPKELNLTTIEPFPETVLIDKFIDTFLLQSQLEASNNMKSQTNEDGTFKWIPLSPIDSTLSGVSSLDSPYTGIVGTNDMLEILLNRFYELTQFVIPNSFYSNTKDVYESYINLYATSEATNIALSAPNSSSSANMKTFAQNYQNSADFIKYLTDNNIAAYKSPKDLNVIDRAYVDKRKETYVGSTIYPNEITLQKKPEDPNNPLYKFMTNTQRGFFKHLVSGGLSEESCLFTNQNTLYIKDAYVNKGEVVTNSSNITSGIPLTTKFITGSWMTENLDVSMLDKLAELGNQGFDSEYSIRTKQLTPDKLFKDYALVWSSLLGSHDIEIESVITTKSQMNALLLLSTFGYTMSPFNLFPNNLYPIFLTTAAIDTPTYVPLYIGALVYAVNNNMESQLKAFFTTGAGKNIENHGAFLLADYHDVKTNMSTIDKQTYLDAFNTFYNQQESAELGAGYDRVRKSLEGLYNVVKNQTGKTEKYYNYLKANSIYNTDFTSPLLLRTNIIVYSDNAFRFNANTFKYYMALESVNKLTDETKNRNDAFFKAFTTALYAQLNENTNEVIQAEVEREKMKSDPDIQSQMYYSFKNINDKWLTNPSRTYGDGGGYPYNMRGKSLIDSFAFVDRGMNPIGDTIINPEVLIDLIKDNNQSVYSVLSQLLSMNHFLFFPLQNFIVHNEESWLDTFKIDPSGIVTKREAFVCMYVGGSSSYPTNIRGNGFINDGIDDLSRTNAVDFKDKNGDCQPVSENDMQKQRNPQFPYSQVRAFRVRFGEQNQSMFKDIKIDSKDYPETNESIQILSRLAGDEGRSQPTPKGQNLYNLYENRSYKATITGLGNAMIQPTQYFQLDNVPMYNGAYLIISVEHDITPNSMVTSFSGTKILRYPVPRVLNPAAAMGFEGTSIGDYVVNGLNAGNNGMTPEGDYNYRNPAPSVESTPKVNGVPTAEQIYGYPQVGAPIDPRKARAGAPFGQDRGDHTHAGQDFPAPLWTPIWSVADGVVKLRKSYPAGVGYGNLIEIDHGNGIKTRYGHMIQFAVDEGVPVKAGDIIGWCGSEGHSSGPHLHFEYIVNGVAKDPKNYLQYSMKTVYAKGQV